MLQTKPNFESEEERIRIESTIDDTVFFIADFSHTKDVNKNHKYVIYVQIAPNHSLENMIKMTISMHKGWLKIDSKYRPILSYAEKDFLSKKGYEFFFDCDGIAINVSKRL